MATQFVQHRIDDLDGTVIDGDTGETIRFQFKDDVYEIDLSTFNALQFRAHISPYVDVARHLEGPTGLVALPSDICPIPDRCAEHDPDVHQDEVEAEARKLLSGRKLHMRLWARENGYVLSSRGRVPNDVVAAYERAMDEKLAGARP